MPNNKFIQIHALTAYGANNLNRDDLSRPKSMIFGGVPRLRISSQCIKRAYRMSDILADLCTGIRTKHMWKDVGQDFVNKGYPEAEVVKVLTPICAAFIGSKSDKAPSEGPSPDATGEASTAQPQAEDPGDKVTAPKGKGKKGANKKDASPASLDDLGNNTLFFYSDSEVSLIKTEAEKALLSQQLPEPADVLKKIEALPMSEDVALFGRMVAGNKALMVEGALQVAHPMTVHRASVEDDYFTAVDDLSTDVDGGAGHLGGNGFGSGVYYHYFNLDIEVLLKNLGGDVERAKRLVEAFIEAVATVAPSGKQNSFAARAYATYLVVEVSQSQPFSYAEAFVRPVRGDNNIAEAIQAIKDTRASIVKAFPKQASQVVELNRIDNTGSLPEVQAAAVSALTAR